MPSETRVWRATRFDGGRNTQASPYDLAPNESPDDLNVDAQVIGAIRRRKGFKKFSQTYYGPDAITGLYRYYKTDGSKYLMVLNGVNLWAGEGTPPSDVVVKNDFTPGSEMFFITMQDWCYFVNFLDRCGRFDGTDLTRVGVAAPAVSAPGLPSASRVVDPDGRITATAGYFTYRFRFRYGKLGASNLSPFFRTTAFGAGFNAVKISYLQVIAPGDLWSLNPASALQPTHLQIYRSLNHTLGTGLTSQQAAGLLYYFVDEIRYPDDLVAGTYTDLKDDLELLSLYGGHTFSEPYLDIWAADADAAEMAHEEGYQLTAKARYVAEHRNRTFYAGIEETTYKEDGSVDETTTYPSRLYWTDLYQPDRWTDFIDVAPEDGDEITQIFSFQNNLMIFKRTRIYLLLGSSPSNFEVRLVNAYVGSMSPRGVSILDDRVIFPGADGIYAYDGANFARLSNKIRPDILAIKETTRQYSAAGSYQGRYYIGYQEE